MPGPVCRLLRNAWTLRNARQVAAVAKLLIFLTLAPSTAALAQSPRIAKPEVSFGTAFAVTEDGDLVTNEHVVSGCNSVDVRLGANKLQGTVTIRDQNDDLALI